MIDAASQSEENELLHVERSTSLAVERRGVQNEGGFLTPYYLFDLMERKHADELDPIGRETHYQPLKRAFFAAQKKITELVGASISIEKTWSAWYKELFQTLGFAAPQFRRLPEPVETAHHGLVPISYGYYSSPPNETAPLIFIDLHPFGTNLDRNHYPNPERSHELTTEPISRALEFALDQNETRWALLSNGTELRLYRRGSSVARQYLKVDFATVFTNEDPKDWLAFWGLFRLAAFLPSQVEEQTSEESSANDSLRCFLDKVIDESQRHATKIADDLRENLVRATEHLLQGVIDTPANLTLWKGIFQGKHVPDEDQLKILFNESVYFLYRLLFVLYAESRDLLPIGESEIYRDTYSLEHLREMAEKPLREEDYEKTYYSDTLRTLFKMLYQGYPFRNPTVTQEKVLTRAKGASTFRIPPYNGRLFSPERTHLLSQCVIPDRALREVIRELSLSHPKKRSERIERYSYADLGVDQLGSIYEGLLVYEPSIADQTMVEARLKNELRLIPQDQADELDLIYDQETRKPAGSFLLRIWGGRRKGSGSYYTPQEITAFLVKDALAPLVEPIIAGCAKRDETGQPLRHADEILNIKVCDPAMGSGAFLVQACRYLGEAYGRAIVAEEQRETSRVGTAELAKYKRRVAEKCLYGVDLNPLAVELAKVSLWLETLAQDRPLTFLDAHLRCGNALIGAPLRNAEGKLDPARLSVLPNEVFGKASKEDSQEFKETLKKVVAGNKKQLLELRKGNYTQLTFLNGDIEQQILADYEKRRLQLEESDEDLSTEDAVALVHQKNDLLQEALTGKNSQLRRLKEICDLWCAAWFWPVDAAVPPPTTMTYHDLVSIILQQPGLRITENPETYLEIVHTLADKEIRFFHWELEFPEVWFDDEGNPLKQGGFDIVVANPPWEAVKANSKEFWSNFLPTYNALDKQDAIRAEHNLKENHKIDVQWKKYIKDIEQKANIFKQELFFSQQDGGDVNTYKLFTEKFICLTKKSGIFSFVVYSAIYTDKYCTSLRRQLFLHQNNRFLFSFENRKNLFPIDSRFKVVLLSSQKITEINDNTQYTSNQQYISCLFLVGKDNSGRDLAPSSMELQEILPKLKRNLFRQNISAIKKLAPNTLSLMESKTLRDTDISAEIYNSHSLLGDQLNDTWNISMYCDFHRTNHSRLFNKQQNGWPLYEGKMIYQFSCDYASPKYWISQEKGLAELTRRAKLEEYSLSHVWDTKTPKLGCSNFRLVYRAVGRNTDEATLIAAILPPGVFIAHSLTEIAQWKFSHRAKPQWTKQFDESQKLLLLSILNSFVLAYIARQKITANVSTYIIKQLPSPRLPTTHPIMHLLVPWAARLTCIDKRFTPLWNEVASHRSQYMATRWTVECAAINPRERAHLRSQIDACVADLYGLNEHDFAYILNTFPLLDGDQPSLPDEERSFVTRDLALLALFQHRGKAPPADIVSFFAEAGVDIRQRTGNIRGLAERVHVAIQEQGAVAYQPTQREKEENEDEETIEQDEFEYDEE